MYVCWYSVVSAILSNRLGTLNPINFNYTALWCLLCFFLRFASGTLPKRFATHLESLPASEAQGHALDQVSLPPCAWALLAAWPQPHTPSHAGCHMGSRAHGKWSGELCIHESWLLGNFSRAAVLLSQGAVVVVQLGPGSACEEHHKLNIGL